MAGCGISVSPCTTFASLADAKAKIEAWRLDYNFYAWRIREGRPPAA